LASLVIIGYCLRVSFAYPKSLFLWNSVLSVLPSGVHAEDKQAAEKLETAPTKFVEAGGIEFAYRSFGDKGGTPLVFLQHFSGTIDDWDPAVVNVLAKDRPVVVFDNTGVGKSSGRTPDNILQMATDTAQFLSALDLKNVDLLGFSLGGLVAQQLAFDHPELVRKIVLAGTAPQGGEEHLLKVLGEAFSQKGASDPKLYLFFTQSEASQAAGRAFLERVNSRQVDRDPPSGQEITDPQAKAIITWCATKDPEHSILKAIRQPVLVVNGSNDIMLPAENSYVMFKHLRDAKLMLYPDSGHGALFQYAEDFVYQTTRFLTG
jgi:pimeloyl-ACP methyl ester carboxylesterase